MTTAAVAETPVEMWAETTRAMTGATMEAMMRVTSVEKMMRALRVSPARCRRVRDRADRLLARVDVIDISILSHILVDFNEPLGDEQLTVFTESGEAVAGSTVVEQYGERLRFLPMHRSRPTIPMKSPSSTARV